MSLEQVGHNSINFSSHGQVRHSNRDRKGARRSASFSKMLLGGFTWSFSYSPNRLCSWTAISQGPRLWDDGTNRVFELTFEYLLQINSKLPDDEKEKLNIFLSVNRDVFAWSAEEMPGILRSVAKHKLRVLPECMPVQQKKWKLGVARQIVVREKVTKLLTTWQIWEVHCPEWVVNPVLIPKANGSWRMCIDYTDLNKAPKDPYPLPNIDVLVDSTVGFKYLCFMDAFAGYNQIKMHPADEEKTTFVTEHGLFCYIVIPFGLRNAGATYQRMTNHSFA